MFVRMTCNEQNILEVKGSCTEWMKGSSTVTGLNTSVSVNPNSIALTYKHLSVQWPF